MIETMKIKETCFWCDADIGGVAEKHFAEDCPSTKLSKEEYHVGLAVFSSDNCDHWCCGLPAAVCRARSISKSLKEFKWQPVDAQ